MNKLLVGIFFGFVLFFVGTVYGASSLPLFRVLKVVDGDTIVVDVRGNRETVRLLGIDTPESVDPRKPVQCFGKAATEKMKSFVGGKAVILVDEMKTQGNRDKYGRLLRYVYLPDRRGAFVNGEMVKQGFAFSYREYPVKMTEKFNRLEGYARERNAGLWGSCGVVSPTLQPKRNDDKDCSDFSTRAEAQEYFNSRGGSPTNNVDKLDNNRDGMACEGLR